MLKTCTLIISMFFSTLLFADESYQYLKQKLGGDQLVFISSSDQQGILIEAESVAHLRSYHNQYLREPLYDDYLHTILINMLGYQGFQHLFKNLGGGFVPIKVNSNILVMKGTQDHCGGMEEAMVLVDLSSGDVTSILYSEESFLIHSTYVKPDYLPQISRHWIKRILDAYGTREQPTRNKIQLRKMAGDWCHGYSP